MRVAAVAKRRGVRRLVHFTPARNLHRIITAGALRSAEDLDADETATYAFTDANRLDGHLDKVCCSVEYPNVYYLHVARSRARLYPDWVALLIELPLLDRPGAFVSPRNAAAGTAITADIDAFNAMYAPTIIGSGGRVYTRRPGHLRSIPTDLQAEVLLPGGLSLSHTSGVMIASEADAATLRAQLEQLGQRAPTHWNWISCPTAFDRDALRRHVWEGQQPEETAL